MQRDTVENKKLYHYWSSCDKGKHIDRSMDHEEEMEEEEIGEYSKKIDRRAHTASCDSSTKNRYKHHILTSLDVFLLPQT